MAMVPRIRRTRDWEVHYGKWMTYCEKHGDITETLGDAVRVWFWYIGVPPKVAFWTFNRWKRSKEEEK